jgi:threonine synthase
MTSAAGPNVHNIAIEGTFDDCQRLVKSLFNDEALRDRLGLTGVNSINIARILAQIVYYFTAAVALGSPHRPVSFTVPTGNFGDIFAGYAAKAMGLPVRRLVIATNANDSLSRAFGTGVYAPKAVIATTSPSMDIQLASNFERLLFELAGRDAGKVRARMQELGNAGAFNLQPQELQMMRAAFACHAIGEHETETTIRTLYEETGELIDPHTAVGVAAAGKERGGDPMIVLSTAHAAKFPEAVKRATGRLPEAPERLKAKLGQDERLTVLANDYGKVASFILDHARATPKSAKSASRARDGVRA